MNQEVNKRLNWWINAMPRVAGATAIAVGTIVLIGWLLDIQLLKSLHPSLVSMKANAALAFVLAGMSLLLHATPEAANWRKAAGFLAFLVFLIGLMTIAEYVFTWDAGIDQLLFKEPQGSIGTFLPGRMAFDTAMSFCLFGLAVLLHIRRSRRSEGAAQVLALVVGVFGLLALVAYLYGLPGLTGYAVYMRMALHTSCTFILLSIGLTCLQPNVGVMAVIRGEGSGGFMARRLMPAAVVAPILLCWVVARGEMEGFYGNQFGDVIDATAYVAIALYLVWLIGRSLNKLDAERKKLELSLLKSEREFKELFDNAPVGYHEVDGEGAFSRINHTELRMLGYQAEEMLGHFAWEFVGNQAESRDALLARLAGRWPRETSVERIFRRKDGTTITAIIEDQVVRDAQDRIIGLRATLQDVTELKRAVKLTQVFYEISQAGHSTGNLVELYRHIHDALSSIIPANNFFIALLANDGKTLTFPYERDEKDTGASPAIRADDPQSLTVEVLLSKRPLSLDQKELLHRYSISKNRVWGTAPKCWLGVPLMIREKAIGVMAVQDYDTDHVYSEKDVTLFELAAAQIAIAIERKRAEHEIRLLAHTISSVKDCVSITDLEDKIIFVNNAFMKTYGYAHEELVGQPISIVRSAKSSPETTSQILETTLRGGWYGEIFNRRKDGSDFPIELWTSMVKDKTGKAIANVGIARDVTNRKVAEQERESLISELKTALENVRTLDGLVPICAHCKKIRDDTGYWNQLEHYIMEHTDAKLTHGLCPDCAKVYFPGVAVKGSGDERKGETGRG